MSYSQDDISPEDKARQNDRGDQYSLALKKHDCKIETKVEIVGEKIYPSVIVRALKAHPNGQLTPITTAKTKEK